MAACAKNIVNDLLDNNPDDLDVPSSIKRYLPSINPNSTVYEKLRSLAAELGYEVGGRVYRNDHRYVHERTTTFEIGQDLPTCEEENPLEAECGALADKVQEMVGEEVININRKIYRALETEYNFQRSDENVDDNIRVNDYEFSEDGAREDGGGFTIDQLSEKAKSSARDWFRDGYDNNDYWSEHVIEEWKEELDDMGFADADISYSGFWSQGDGASFTCRRFDYDKWCDWRASAKATTKGHPYTDDLKVTESEEEEYLDSPEAFNLKANLLSPVAQIAVKNGFTKYDQHGNERWIKHLSNGSMAELQRTQTEYAQPYDQAGTGGPYWRFLIIPRQGPSQELACAKEQVMVYLMQACMQRLATWPRSMAKPKL